MTDYAGPPRPAWLDDEVEPEVIVEALRADGDLNAESARTYLETATMLAQSDTHAAARVLDVCEQMAVELAAGEVLASCHYLRARLRVVEGRADDALGLIASAKDIWLDLGRPLEALRTELGRTHVLDDLGRHHDAVEAVQQLLVDLDTAEAAETSEQDKAQIAWMRAASFENLGAAYGLVGDYEAALEACRSAERAYDLIGSPADRARSRANSGVALLSVGQALDALEALDAAAEIFLGSDDQLSYAKTLGHAADAEVLLGRYADALARYEQARRILDANNATTEACRVRLRTVKAYLALNLVDEAEQIAGEVAEIVAGLGLEHDASEARWLHAVAKLRAGSAPGALEGIEAAAVAAAESGDGPLEVQALLTWSEALLLAGDVDQATVVGARALARTEGNNWPAETVHVHLAMARLADDPAVIDHHLAEAMRISHELPLPHLRYPVLLALGRNARLTGDTELAARRLREAVDVVEQLRGLLPDEAIRTSYLDGRTAAHADLIALLVEGEIPDDLGAFDLAESSKSRTLSDLVAGVVQPSSVSNIESDLDAAYSTLTDGGIGDGRLKLVSRRAEELEQRLRIAQFQADAPSGGAADVPQSPSAARPGQTDHVLEYHVLDDDLVAFVWVAGELHVCRLPGAVGSVVRLLDDWSTQRRRQLASAHLAADRAAALGATADRVLGMLWATVFEEVETWLDPDAPDLLIVPHGPLHQVPFHALGPGPGRAPVGLRWNVALAPSFALSQTLKARTWDGVGRRSLVLGVGDDVAPLVADEAEFVAGALPGADLLLGEAATVEALTTESVDRSVIHLACHGIHRDRNPMFSALRLGDRWFTAREALSLSLSGSMVVLSACETGRQNGRGSIDEAMGLARAFVAAGACAVVVSLWLAGDVATSLLMRSFYGHLLAGSRPAAALAKAQADLIHTHPHPADWAPFVVHGGL